MRRSTHSAWPYAQATISAVKPEVMVCMSRRVRVLFSNSNFAHSAWPNRHAAMSAVGQSWIHSSSYITASARAPMFSSSTRVHAALPAAHACIKVLSASLSPSARRQQRWSFQHAACAGRYLKRGDTAGCGFRT
eukprot:scaffold229838_cov22-Tisochrysis_lutea.AAC.1